MKKPTKPPPPPPLPPRCQSLARSGYSLPRQTGGGSEYAESVCSMPFSTRSLQPPMRSFSPTGSHYHYCRSESAFSASFNCPAYRTMHYAMPSTQIVKSHPVPKERVSNRPRICISPMPTLKNDHAHYTCDPGHYRRHLEQHLRKLFKYLSDREQRRRECIADIKSNNCLQNEETFFLNLFKTKESKYLRELRTRISKDDFKVVAKLGSGFFGNVSLVQKISNKPVEEPMLYAMKEVKKDKVNGPDRMAHVMAERDILAEADNEWIVKLYYSFQDNDKLYFILEYVPGGDMMSMLCTFNVLSEDWARFYIAEISLAVQFVHDMKFIHRDIKPDNILIDAKGHIKLADFGLCTSVRWTHESSYYKDDTQNSVPHQNDKHPTITKALTKRDIEQPLKKRSLSAVGSTNYQAPEVVRQTAIGPQESTKVCDWWSVGVILYEMVVGYCPFIDLEKLKVNAYNLLDDPPENIQKRIMNWKDHLDFPSPTDPNSPPCTIPGYYISDDTKALIKGLLCDPNDRLCQNGISDIQNHPFFKGIDWKIIRSTKAPYVPELRDEYDTRYFELQSREPDITIESGTTTEMTMNDFTYKAYWTKPPSLAQ